MNYGTIPGSYWTILRHEYMAHKDGAVFTDYRIATWRHSRRSRWRQLFYKIK
jgi:hypothetical protein